MDSTVLSILRSLGNGNIQQIIGGPSAIGYNPRLDIWDASSVGTTPSGDVLGSDDMDLLETLSDGTRLLTKYRVVAGVVSLYPQVKL